MALKTIPSFSKCVRKRAVEDFTVYKTANEANCVTSCFAVLLLVTDAKRVGNSQLHYPPPSPHTHTTDRNHGVIPH